jgi:heptosyltransferase I
LDLPRARAIVRVNRNFRRAARSFVEMPRVLIIKPSSLGDIVHGLQMARSLRAQAPAWTVDWVAAEAFAPLVRASTDVERVFVFDRHGPLGAFARLTGDIRATAYDWALDLQGLARSALLLAAARATHRAGRADAREGARLLYPLRPALPPAGRTAHALDILLQFLPLLGLRAEAPGPLTFRPPETPALPAELSGRAPVVLFPDSRRPEKQWPGFAALTALLLAARPDLSIAWAGRTGPTPDPSWPTDRFWNLIGRTPLEALPALLQAARLVVANDSGPMHLAAALERPVVALFGPTDPARFGPYPSSSPRHHLLRAPGGDLQKLDPADVLAAITKALA